MKKGSGKAGAKHALRAAGKPSRSLALVARSVPSYPSGSSSSALPPPTLDSTGPKDKEPASACDTGSAGKKRGRPEKAIEQIAEEHIEGLKTADNSSKYFGDGAGAQMRSVARYALTASTKLFSAKADREAGLVDARKKLQIVESCMKVHEKWATRKSTSAPTIQEFMIGWSGLLNFCESEPPVAFDCPFLSDLHLQVLSCTACDSPAELVKHLTTDCLSKHFPGTNEADLELKQRKFIKQGLASILSSESGSSKAQSDIVLLVQCLAAAAARKEFAEAVTKEVVILEVFVAPPPISFEKKDMEVLEGIITGLPSAGVAASCAGLIAAFSQFPRHGKAHI
jgi:hypothetical protein